MRHINKKNVVEISILNSERHLLRFFFPSSFIEWNNVDTTVQGSGF